MVAAGAGFAVWLLGWRGVDVPAQLYRVTMFHRNGLTLWDSQWYGGHWTLDYTVIFTPVAGVLGLSPAGIASAVVAALAFDRLVVGHFARAGRVGSLLFAIGTLVQLAIGQLPFLMGEALALAACWAAARRKWPLAVVLAIATALASPLAGAFLLLAVVAWLLARWPDGRLGFGLMAAGVAVPVLATSVAFPGQGAFPYAFTDFAFEAGVALVMLVLLPKRERVLRLAAALYLLAMVGTFAVRSPLGGNIGRLGECLAVPLAACLLWPKRRLLLVALAIPLVLFQWTPAWSAMTGDGSGPSTRAAYFQPLVSILQRHDQPPGRVEIVPTAYHWEAAYVAPDFPLARGWERQLDTANNPLFYEPGELNATSYLGWLLDNGVRYVALPDARLDFAGVAEARLIQSGVPGLVPAWRTAHWQVFAVAGSTGIVDGPARLVRMDGDRVALEAIGAGRVLLRVRYTPQWTVTAGAACVAEAPGKWIMLDLPGPELVKLGLRLAPGPAQGRSTCPSPTS